MKWNIVIGALAVSACLCGQSFGSNLMVKKLASNDCAAAAAPACTAPAAAAPANETPAPSSAAAPSCGSSNNCCKPLFSGLKGYFDCRFPCGPPLVIKPISWHHRCR